MRPIPLLLLSTLLAAVEVPNGLTALPPAPDGAARAQLAVGATTWAFRRTTVPGGLQVWIAETPADAGLVAALAGIDGLPPGPALLDDEQRVKLRRGLDTLLPDAGVRPLPWAWRRPAAPGDPPEMTSTHVREVDAMLAPGWLLAGGDPGDGELIARARGFVVKTRPERRVAVRYALLDVPAPVANAVEARGPAGFRLEAAGTATSEPGWNPGRTRWGETVRAGHHRFVLWIHGADGRLQRRIAVPGPYASWLDGERVEVFGDGGVLTVHAGTGAVLAVRAGHSANDDPDGIAALDDQREATDGPLAVARDVRLLPDGRSALLLEGIDGRDPLYRNRITRLELGSGRILWRRPVEVYAESTFNRFALAIDPRGRWFAQACYVDGGARGQLRSLADGTLLRELAWDGAMPMPQAGWTSADGETVAFSTYEGGTTAWRVRDGARVDAVPPLPAPTWLVGTGDSWRSPAGEVGGDGPRLAGEVAETSGDDAPRSAALAIGDRLVAVSKDGLLRVWDAQGRLQRVLGGVPCGPPVGLRALPQGRLLSAHLAGGWAVWDLAGGLLAWSNDGWLTEEAWQADRWAVDERNGLFYTAGCGSPYELVARRLPSLEPVWSWSVTRDGGALAMAMDGSYFAERDAAYAMTLVLGDQRTALGAFDLALNRPERVVAGLGFAPPEEVALWTQLRERRLARNPAAPVEPREANRLARCALAAPGVAVAVVPITISAAGPRPLTRLLVAVDGVPWPEAAGRALPGTASWSGTVEVPVLPGDNRIEISAVDDQGLEGLRSLVRVRGLAPAAPPRLHVVALGVGAYPRASAEWQLDYAAKDARDVAALLAASGHRQVESIVLTDAEVVPSAFAALRQRLLASRAEDAVLVFAAGHGSLDRAGGYRFHDAGSDPADPDSGLPWSAFEALLDGIPARDRIVLLDTCASGDADGPAPAALPPGVRWRGMVRVGGPRLPLAAAFLDPGRGIGAQVVAAAGAAEVSIELGELKNGIFTAALRRGLGDGLPADEDGDGMVTARELAGWAVREVDRLSAGAQRPRLRSANPGRGTPVFLPRQAVQREPRADEAEPAATIDEAWSRWDAARHADYLAAAAADADPTTPRDAAIRRWAAFATTWSESHRRSGSDWPQLVATARAAGQAWPQLPAVAGAPATAKPAWAVAHGVDAHGTWAEAQLGLRFRFIPAGAAPAGADGQIIPNGELPACWIAEMPLSAGVQAALLKQQPDRAPIAAGWVRRVEVEQLLPLLSAALGVRVAVPQAGPWVRAMAGAAGRFDPASSEQTYEDVILPAQPPGPWGLRAPAVHQEWLRNGEFLTSTRSPLAAVAKYYPRITNIDGSARLRVVIAP
jgi:hypothetical protein